MYAIIILSPLSKFELICFKAREDVSPQRLIEVIPLYVHIILPQKPYNGEYSAAGGLQTVRRQQQTTRRQRTVHGKEALCRQQAVFGHEKEERMVERRRNYAYG